MLPTCLLLLSAALLSCSEALPNKVCCSKVGCFPTDGHWAHLPAPLCPDEMKPKFGLFTQQNMLNGQEAWLDRDSPIPSVYSPARRTMFVVHGYWGHYNSDFMHQTKNATLAKYDMNVVLVGWDVGADEIIYPDSAANTRTVGAEIALIINRLKAETGADDSTFWCVGHSLGAHTCGFAGLKTDLDRITALDPAGPWFHDQPEETRVNQHSARFVDAIHTDGAGLFMHYGMLNPSGHVDFYPNGGKYQPGCVTSMPMARLGADHAFDGPKPSLYNKESLYCSHFRATDLFVESIVSDICFKVHKICQDEHDMPTACDDMSLYGEVPEPTMGFEADLDRSVRGLYYLETTAKHPFCVEEHAKATR